MKTVTLSLILMFSLGTIKAGDTAEVFNWEKDCIQTIHWGIILSTKDYNAAKTFAESAAAKLEMEFSDRGYIYSETEMLADTVECGCGNIHGYIPRGRYDNGEYVSIEVKGDYYVVVVTSGDKDSEEFNASLDKARILSPDAYVLPQEIWVCCMH